jgi:acetyl esterase/lipase
MNKIPIWGKQIPGNSSQKKKDFMEIKGFQGPKLFSTLKLVISVTSKEFSDSKKSVVDSYTWNQAVKRGWEKETFEDVPSLEAYPVTGAHQAVIVIPGGAYAFKQTDYDGLEKQNEGKRVAEALNAQGISAFVLWYRSNPYYFPIPLLDVQRAVRYLRAYAAGYGFDPDQISLIGFSAGGYQSLGFADILLGKNCFPDDYQPDEIDILPDSIQSAAAGYPLTSFRAIPNCCYAVMPGNQARDMNQREDFFNKYDLDLNYSSTDVPQFITYGTKDSFLIPEVVEKYIRVVQEHGGEIKAVPVPGANHGYGANPDQKNAIFWVKEYTDWLKKFGKDRFPGVADLNRARGALL